MNAGAQTDSAAVAFFDVDETLISLKSMRSFLDFYFEPDRPFDEPDLWSRLQQRAAGLPRADGNRIFYELWKGQPVSEVLEAGRRWFGDVSTREGFWLVPTVERLARHRALGHAVVLVSGSFHACLLPLAQHLGADRVLATGLESRDGVLTGAVSRSMIGEGKAAAVRDYLDTSGADRALTWGYGDHASDLPLLEAVAHAVVVGEDPTLGARADQEGWERLSISDPPLTETVRPGL